MNKEKKINLDFVAFIGIGTCSYGIALISIPFAYIFAGICFILISILSAK